jgi:predicted 3-demethylubiquinone-9 3-methyltransferase (glyoxalase superfamily)
MKTPQRFSTCLWFDHQGEQAARFYTGIFKNSKINAIMRYGEAGKEIHGRKPGSVMTVEFELDGRSFLALNGGPLFKFTEAISLIVNCKTQKEVDYYWRRLSAGGDKKVQACGWLKDKFGVSWQIIPAILPRLVGDPKSAKSQRAMSAMMNMTKLDIAKLKKAYSSG